MEPMDVAFDAIFGFQRSSKEWSDSLFSLRWIGKYLG